jgi:hypothetical protein
LDYPETAREKRESKSLKSVIFRKLAEIKRDAGMRFSLFSLCPIQPPHNPCIHRSNMNIVQFEKYCNEKFDLKTREQRIRDQRKRPEIPTAAIVKSVREMAVLGQTSLLAMDQYARSPEARKWHGSQRKMVVSDTTVPRVLEGVDQGQVMEIPYEAVRQLDQESHWDWKLPTGRKVRAGGIVDGSCFGGFWASTLMLAGSTEAVLDLEPYEGRGHELAASRRVLRRANKRLGKGFFDLILGDGLYPTQKDFRLCRRELGSDLLVKTEEESLTVIEDARNMFFPRRGKRLEAVKRAEGVDPSRQICYEVIWSEGFEWQELEYPMTVAYVREKRLKPIEGRPEVTQFWALTTFEGLVGEELRELAHGRWKIENGIFKRLNALVESKHYASHHSKVQEMLLRLWMLGLTLLGVYLFHRGLNQIKQSWQSMKITWRWITERMRLSLYEFSLAP